MEVENRYTAEQFYRKGIFTEHQPAAISKSLLPKNGATEGIQIKKVFSKIVVKSLKNTSL